MAKVLIAARKSPRDRMVSIPAPFLCLLILLFFSSVASVSAQTWRFCANEGQTCSFSGVALVRYGAKSKYFYQTATNSIVCNNATFGDPIFGRVKHCDYATSSTVQTASPFDFSLSRAGDTSVKAGSSVTNTIAASLVSGTSQQISFSVAGLPSGTMTSFSQGNCSPSCSTQLTISTSIATAAGSFPIT